MPNGSLCYDSLSFMASVLVVFSREAFFWSLTILYHNDIRRLKAAGVAVEVNEFAGVLHGFFNLPALYPQALEAHASVANFIASRVAASF